MYHERIVESIEKTYEPDKNYVMITADTAADIPNPAEHPEWEVGSELVVLENGGSKYRLSNSREWIAVNFNSGGGGDSTKLQEELDKAKAMLDAVIDKSITSVKSNATTVGDSVFNGCTSLTTADFPLATSIGSYVFNGCRSLTTVYFPLVTSADSSAFSDCTSLTSVDLPLVTSIAHGMFSNCASLTTVYFPLVTSVDGSAFNGCTSLTTVDFPIATSIGSYAFYGCTSLTTVDFPLVKDVQQYAFRDCTSLTKLILRSTTIGTGSTVSLKNTPIESGAGHIYVPKALVSSYKSATNWSTYAAQYRALEDYTVDGTITGELDETKI